MFAIRLGVWLKTGGGDEKVVNPEKIAQQKYRGSSLEKWMGMDCLLTLMAMMLVSASAPNEVVAVPSQSFVYHAQP